MKPQAADVYKKLRACFDEVHTLLFKLRPLMLAEQSQEELADIAFALKRAGELADSMRKDCNNLGELTQKMACLKSVNLEEVEPIRTWYVTATPDCRIEATLPKRSTDPEAYFKLMDYLGVPRQVSETSAEESDVVRPHWPGAMQRIGELMAAGKPLPPGIDMSKTFPKYRLIMREKHSPDAVKGKEERPEDAF